jgi:hypothetical protein
MGREGRGFLARGTAQRFEITRRERPARAGSSFSSCAILWNSDLLEGDSSVWFSMLLVLRDPDKLLTLAS